MTQTVNPITSTTTLTVGTHTIVATYRGSPNFAPSQSKQQTQVVSGTGIGSSVGPPVVPDGPEVVSLLRYGYHMKPTTLVLTFDQALDSVTAADVKDYRIIGPGGRVIGIKRAVYDPATLTVRLHPKERINVHYLHADRRRNGPQRPDQHPGPVARRRG